MEVFKNRVKTLSKILDTIAGFAIAASMVLVVTNVLLSNIFGIKALGKFEYEYVGFLASIAIGLGIAYCAVNDAHIAITIFTDKMNAGANKVIDIISGAFTMFVLSIFTVEFFKYAGKLFKSGEVSPTTQTPAYIIVIITGLGFIVYSLVMFAKTHAAFNRTVTE